MKSPFILSLFVFTASLLPNAGSAKDTLRVKGLYTYKVPVGYTRAPQLEKSKDVVLYLAKRANDFQSFISISTYATPRNSSLQSLLQQLIKRWTRNTTTVFVDGVVRQIKSTKMGVAVALIKRQDLKLGQYHVITFRKDKMIVISFCALFKEGLTDAAQFLKSLETFRWID